MAKEKDHEIHHGQPITRRDFLARGILAYSALTTLPGVFGAAFRSAQAEADPASVLPFLAFDMAGGSALPGNFLVGKMGGPQDFLASYDRLGWNPREPSGLNESFGLPMSANRSELLKGLLATASAEARKNLRMGSLCHFSQDDVTTNKMNAATLVARSGGYGQYVRNGLGITQLGSGGNSDSALPDLSLKPTFVGTIDDILGATKFGGETFRSLLPSQLRTLATDSLRLAQLQGKTKGAADLTKLTDAAYQKSLDFVDGVKGLDPREDGMLRTIYGIAQQTAPNDGKVIAAAITSATLRGFAGPSVWTLGGCDYHTGSNLQGDQKDREMGEQIGRAVQTAYTLQRPLFFQLLTDGGIDAAPGTRNWRGDSGDKGLTILGFYHPKAAPEMKRLQVGHYTDGQGAERTTLLGSNPQLVGYAAFANYLQCCGQLAAFNKILPGIFTGSGELESVLIFKGSPA